MKLSVSTQSEQRSTGTGLGVHEHICAFTLEDRAQTSLLFLSGYFSFLLFQNIITLYVILLDIIFIQSV